jgi:hypothetical protein
MRDIPRHRMTSPPGARKKFHWPALAVLTVALVAMHASAAHADNAIVSSDGVTLINGSFGTVCVNSTTDAHAQVEISRLGSTSSPNTFPNGAAVTISVDSVSGAGLSALMENTTIVLPGNWGSVSNNTLSSAVWSTLTLVAGSSAGAFSGSVTYRATSQSVSRTGTLNVYAQISDTGSCAPEPPDTTAPTVTVSFPDPINGRAGWFNTADNPPVVGSVIASDASGITAISCAGATLSDATGYGSNTASGTLTVSGDGTHSVTCTATDGAGNSGAAGGSVNTATVKIDASPPTISDAGFSAGTPGDNGWYVSPVTEGFTASDSTSGLDDCAGSFTQSSGVTDEGAAATIATGPCSDIAGNTNPGVSSTPYKIDLTPPTVSCDTPPTLLLNQAPATVFATVTDALSGPESSTVTRAADTSSVGAKSVSLTGYDNAGNATTVSCGYSIIYNWIGFLQPLSSDPTVINAGNAGRTYPIKWQLADANGAYVTDVVSGTTIGVAKVSCGNLTGNPTDTIDYTSSAGDSSLRYDSAANQYVYNWTSPSTKSTCYRMTVTTPDMRQHTALFSLR